MAQLKAGTTVAGSLVLTDATHNNTGNPHDQYPLTTYLVENYYTKTATDALLDLKVDLTQLPSLEQDKLDAEAAAAAALMSEQNALASANAADNSASAASTSASNANNSAIAAALSEENAATSESLALAYRNRSQEWAENPEDVSIPGNIGSFSSLHHARKAAASALAALASENTALAEANRSTAQATISATQAGLSAQQASLAQGSASTVMGIQATVSELQASLNALLGLGIGTSFIDADGNLIMFYDMATINNILINANGELIVEY